MQSMYHKPKGSGANSNYEQGFTVIWKNLVHKVKRSRLSEFASRETSPGATNNNKSLESIILNNISGSAKSNELTAILGPSGAGKSTLLHCLFRGHSTNTTGRIIVQTKPGSKPKKLEVCFIPQNDYLNEWLTVREDLIFVSKLMKKKRIKKSVSTDQDRVCDRNLIVQDDGINRRSSYVDDHEANACEVAERLGLTNCLDVLITNISGGEKKRLSLARELMSRPDILVLDEPTTGLDSSTCYKTVMVLKNLVRQSPHPLAVVVTIHQPDKSVFNLFNRAYVLTKNGQVMFDDSPRQARSTVERISRSGPLAALTRYNPASLLIEIGSDDKYNQERKRLIHLMRNRLSVDESAPTGNFSRNLTRSMSVQISSRSQEPGELETPFMTETLSEYCSEENQDDQTYYISPQLKPRTYRAGLNQSMSDAMLLCHRAWLSIIRDPSLTRARLIFHVVFPLLMVFVFGDAQAKANGCPIVQSDFKFEDMRKSIKGKYIERMIEDYRTSADNMGYYFILIYALSVNALSLSASFYPQKINMLRKETRNGLYSPFSFLVGQSISEFPFEFVLPFLSGLLAYYFSGQPRSYLEWRMLSTALVIFLFNYSNYWFGLMSGLLSTDNLTIAVLMAQSILVPTMCLTGVVIRPARMPGWLRVISFFSHYQRAVFAIMSSRYGFNACSCTPDMIVKKKTGLLTPGMSSILDQVLPQDNSTGWDIPASQFFKRLTNQYDKALTYGVNINSCDDVKPKIMNTYDIIDEDLFIAMAFLLIWIILFQMIVYWLLKKAQNKLK